MIIKVNKVKIIGKGRANYLHSCLSNQQVILRQLAFFFAYFIIRGDDVKVLNLYAGIGGNRKLWEDVEVTAVENNPEIAKVYQEFFPNDKVIIGDARIQI